MRIEAAEDLEHVLLRALVGDLENLCVARELSAPLGIEMSHQGEERATNPGDLEQEAEQVGNEPVGHVIVRKHVGVTVRQLHGCGSPVLRMMTAAVPPRAVAAAGFLGVE